MLNPWLVPLTMTSASVIAMRAWMMVPVSGRPTAWQRREAVRMVSEKLDAAREAQAEAIALAWRLTFAPWSVWGPLAGRSLHEAVAAATESVVAPFDRRATTNARRLRARAGVPMLAAMAAAPVAAPLFSAPRPKAAVIPIASARRRRRRAG